MYLELNAFLDQHSKYYDHTCSYIKCTPETRLSPLIYDIPLQIIVKIVAFRLKYFTHKFEVFDGIVVVVSWVLDIASMYVAYVINEWVWHVGVASFSYSDRKEK